MHEEKEKSTIDNNNNAEVNLSISYKNETPINNGSIEKAIKERSILNTTITLDFDYTTQEPTVDPQTGETVINTVNHTFKKEYNLKDYLPEIKAKGISLSDLKEYYQTHSNSSAQTYAYLKQYIIDNKNNPEVLNATVSSLLDNFEDFYDDNRSHKGVAGSQPEILETLIKAEEGEQIKGMICGPIHNFIMNTLHDCGINAIIIGGENSTGGGHCTLLYQQPDGKYVFNNYGLNIVINASNILDALAEVYKRSGNFESNGYYMLEDGGNTSFSKYAYKQEGAFGDEMDKGDYNNISPFEHNIAPKNTINGNIEISNLGNISATAGKTFAYDKKNSQYETSFTFGYKKNEETAIFHDSESIGIKAEHKKLTSEDDKKTFFETKGIVSYISGNTDVCNYSSETRDAMNQAHKAMLADINKDLAEAGLKDVNYGHSIDYSYYVENKNIKNLSTFMRGVYGKEKTLYKSETTELINAAQISGNLGMSVALNNDVYDFDARIAAEEGFGLKNTGKDFSVKSNISAGLIEDLKLKFTGLGFGFQPGIKLNAGSTFDYKPSDNFNIGGEVRAYTTATQAAKDYGVSAGVSTFYKPENSKVSFFGKANYSVDKEKLTMGGFNETIEDLRTFSALVGVNLNNNTTLTAGYSKKQNALNHTWNNSTASLGAVIKF